MAEKSEWIVCADEIPNFQVLERNPIRRAIPESIEQRELEYVRHGTVNLLIFLVVHSGQMKAICLDTKSAKNYVTHLERFRKKYHRLHCAYLIHDSDPTHTAAWTQDYLNANRDYWRERLTPAHASWLNQAEMLNGAFCHRYLDRGSWTNRDELISHVESAQVEYNRLYAHPFEWTWTNQQMCRWFEKHKN